MMRDCADEYALYRTRIGQLDDALDLCDQVHPYNVTSGQLGELFPGYTLGTSVTQECADDLIRKRNTTPIDSSCLDPSQYGNETCCLQASNRRGGLGSVIYTRCTIPVRDSYVTIGGPIDNKVKMICTAVLVQLEVVPQVYLPGGIVTNASCATALKNAVDQYPLDSCALNASSPSCCSEAIDRESAISSAIDKCTVNVMGNYSAISQQIDAFVTNCSTSPQTPIMGKPTTSPIESPSPLDNSTLLCNRMIESCSGLDSSSWYSPCIDLGDSCCKAACQYSTCVEKSLSDPQGSCSGVDFRTQLNNAQDLIRNSCFNNSCSTDPVSWNSCFPSVAQVELESGMKKALYEVKEGDRVLSSNGHFSEVFFFSHRIVEDRYFDFLQVETPTTTLTVSGNHLIYTKKGLVSARSLSPTDQVVLKDGTTAPILSIREVRALGLLNPHTLDGTLVVDGVLTSCLTTSVPSKMASVLLVPIKFVYRLGLPPISFLSQGAPLWLLRLISQAVAQHK
uniref:Hint domain-containing protein n=1 Tax=Compsopogon caeruleus TaxID=31354 RepID=A0A7S1TGT8_9RHOD